MYFRHFLMEEGVALHFNKLESPLPKVWLKLVKWFLRIRFINFVNVFSLFRNNLLWEKCVALHLNKLESSSPKWFLRRRFLNFVDEFSQPRSINLCRNYLLLEKDVALHLNRLEPLLPDDALCQVWLNLFIVYEKKMKMFTTKFTTTTATTTTTDNGHILIRKANLSLRLKKKDDQS